MNFDWKKFCTERGIPFVEHGPNVGKENISIHCPFCGDADPSEHMGLSLSHTKPFWGCWRDQAHRGRNPSRLLRRLGLSEPEIRELLKDRQQAHPEDLDELSRLPDHMLRRRGASQMYSELRLPRGFVPLEVGIPAARPFIRYLNEERGFDMRDINQMCKRHRLMFCTSGRMKWRIIYPVLSNGKVIDYTGRHIGNNPQRYMTPQNSRIKELIGGWDLAVAGNMEDSALLIVEGPFDLLKLSTYAPYNLNPVCTFGTSVTNNQIAKLTKLARQFGHTFVLFDAEAEMEGASLANQLRELTGKESITFIANRAEKDPGAMSPNQISNLCADLWSLV